MKKSQTEQILNWLKKGHKLNPLQALRKFGSFRLGARVFEIKEMGYNINKKMKKKNGKYFAEYSLEG